jgi:hypothetical protein
MLRLENGQKFLAQISIKMNNIPTKQNEPGSLNLLLAQRKLYSKAKVCFTWRISLALLFAIVGPLVSATFSNASTYVGITSIIYFLLNLLVLEHLESAHKENAAKLQEMLDVYLFDLPWNEYVTGKRPDSELIAKALEKQVAGDISDLIDWYPVVVGKVSIPFARLVCQRSNAWWDTNLRRRYLWFLVTAVVVVLIVVVVASVIVDLTIAKFLLGIVFPALPFGEVVIQQIKQNQESSRLTTELKQNIDVELTKAIAAEIEQDSINVARIFQDQIFRHRSKSSMVFDWIHRIAKPTYEKRMQFSAEEKINEFIGKNRN